MRAEPLGGPHLGFPMSPADLLIDEDGTPQRIDKAFSWDAPFAAHGLMHSVINNAAKADPYPIEVLFLYMANMGWNSAMNPPDTNSSTAGMGAKQYSYAWTLYSVPT